MLENVIMLSIRLAVYIFIVNNVNSYLIYSIYWNVKYRFTLYKLNTRISCTYLETYSNTLDSFYPVSNDQDHYPNSAKSARYTEYMLHRYSQDRTLPGAGISSTGSTWYSVKGPRHCPDLHFTQKTWSYYACMAIPPELSYQRGYAKFCL